MVVSLRQLIQKNFFETQAPAIRAHRSHGIVPLEEGSGENGTLIITRDDPKGSIDSAKITKLIAEVFSV